MLTLAIVTEPVTIFFIVLVIILLAPVLLTKLHIPHIIGMIVAGVVVGPYGLDILDSDSSFKIFGQVGLLYLMFLAGLEIDMYHLKLNFKRGLVFGLLTFFIPMIIGAAASMVLLNLQLTTAALLGSMFASHTLIAYPIAARFGITKNQAVVIAVVGTIIAVIGALLVLGTVVNIHQVGSFEISEQLKLLGKMAVYCIGVLYVYPRLTRWFFKNYSDKVTQFVFILALVFCSAWLSNAIGLEAVLGAFFAGLVLNRYVPSGSSLMGRIEFVGNALFIPYFLIGVGMMINLKVIGNTDTLIATAYMLVIALVTKWLAAWIAQRIYGMNGDSRRLLFGLTTAHTAVALAVVTIGYNMLNSDGTRMMDETILNGTILVILITCAIAPVVTATAAARIKIDMLDKGDDEEEKSRKIGDKMLVPIANPMTATPLVELALYMMSADDSDGPEKSQIFALHVRNDNTPTSKAIGRNSLDLARETAAAVDIDLTPIERYDLNTITGIVNVIEERDINGVILGMHRKTAVIDSFFGSKIDQLLKTTNRMVVISRCYIPINTITRIVVFVPEKAEFETGFRRWLVAIGNLTRQLGCRIIFCCHSTQHKLIEAILRRERIGIRSEYRQVDDYDDFILLSNRILDDDLFVVISSRANAVSYSSAMTEMPSFLQKYFSNNNLMVIYPEQFGDDQSAETFVDPLSSDITTTPSPILVKLRGIISSLMGIKKRGRHNNRRDKIEL